ncbi:MAG: hypothetical protein AAB426_12270 [Myxococcota bacterium]
MRMSPFARRVSAQFLTLSCVAVAALVQVGCGAGSADAVFDDPNDTTTCEPESETVFCGRVGRNCGPASGTDSCDAARTVTSCGSCVGLNETCGGGGEGVCGVPGGLIISVPLTFDTYELVQGGTLTGTVTYANTSDAAIDLTDIVIAARPPGGTHAGGPYLDLTPSTGATSIAAGASLLVTASRTFSAADTVGQWEAYATYETSIDAVWHDGPSVFFSVTAAACVAESDPEFCSRLGASCGSVSANDNCGTSRTVASCGAACVDPATCGGGGIANVCGEPGAATPKLGTNFNWCADWDPEKLPADLVWSARPWATGDGNGTNVGNWAPIDAQGWPMVSVGTSFGAIFEGDPWVGTYKLSFKDRDASTTGDAVTSRSGNITLTNKQHDAGTNITTYDVNVPSFVEGQFIWLMWAGTTGGVTNVHLMRPLKDGSGWHAIGTPLSDFIIDRLAHFTTIRVMHTQGSAGGKAGGEDVTWAGRTKPWSVQTRSSEAGRPGGVAIENLIAMANQAGKDLWLVVPFLADDDYILKMAQVLRYGSDGVSPYTAAQASPVFPPLRADLRVYVEHGNEIWNSGGAYWESENYAADGAERAAGDPHHTGYRTSSSSTWGMAWRRVGYLVVRQALIFRGVFGDAAMMTRVRPILATQHVRYATTQEPFDYIRDVWGQGYNTTVVYGEVNEYGNVAHPVSYYLYALATAPYFPAGNTAVNVTSAATILDSVIGDLSQTTAGTNVPAMTWNADIAHSFGIEYVAYEGGGNLIPQLMPGGATSTTIANALAASYDPVDGARMGANIDPGTGLPRADQTSYAYGRALSAWASAGGTLFVHFVLGSDAGGSNMFGLCPPSTESGSDPRLESGPKWDAIKAFTQAWGQ